MAEIKKLHELLDRAAAKQPGAPALIFHDGEFSYGELHAASMRLSKLLSNNKIGSGDRVAICAPKSFSFVVAQFAILRCGAAYLPVDFFAPVLRNKTIIENCSPKALIADFSVAAQFQEKYDQVAELADGLLLMLCKREPVIASPPDLAYILYTSGSTGTPKGVMYTHAAAMQFINWCSSTFSPSSGDRFSSHAPFHFDLSIFDLFVSISHGATLVLIDEETAKHPMLLASLISEMKISIWYSTPTILRMLASYGKLNKYNYPALRLVLFAGEVYPPKQFIQLRQHWKNAGFYNLYGPTETNVCTWYRIPEVIDAALKSFPIGTRCSHYSNRLTDSNELLVTGPGMMLGYWEAPELTNKAFMKDDTGRLWYRTGDIVGMNDHNELVFHGRADRMVKRKGYRIELAEIEAALHLNPAVLQNACISSEDNEGTTIITAFIKWDPDSPAAGSMITMKEFCIKNLPGYMTPDNFIFLEHFPQTASNKIDYQQLKSHL